MGGKLINASEIVCRQIRIAADRIATVTYTYRRFRADRERRCLTGHGSSPINKQRRDNSVTMTVPTVPLPEILPIFPLTGMLLLPGTILPLHIFEPRYRNMVQDALDTGRVFGMIQPFAPQQDN